jgi:hypothetical protein
MLASCVCLPLQAAAAVVAAVPAAAAQVLPAVAAAGHWHLSACWLWRLHEATKQGVHRCVWGMQNEVHCAAAAVAAASLAATAQLRYADKTIQTAVPDGYKLLT